ncbi:hypothetical protein [Amycolatopsis pithecellobii]|uniref:Uncharacterized protein n=1 Tax=Amycolatopsis pithecellobii TaxID=664692 RepID=A0A6N7YRP8_9PSEU|nr:hypothetical protein [Amycolatopsis pithecellobii]MTD55707.1 hypothetical protein [Amycolatopsis pithecellobii]
MSEDQMPITYYIDNQEKWTETHPGGYYPTAGTGLIWSNGQRYRVADVWFGMEKNAAMTMGVHVFLTSVPDDEDRPAELYPDYYRA